MDFSLRLLGSEMDLAHILNNYKKIMSDYFWDYARSAVVHTRSYIDGLRLVERLYELNQHYYETKLITIEEYEDYDKKLIEFRLLLLDRSDQWFDYIEFFEKYRLEKDYKITFEVVGELLYPPVDLVFMSYLLKEEGNTKYLHFLFNYHYRYELIKKKMKKIRQGKKDGNMYHKKQSEFSNEEIERRFRDIMDCADRGIQVKITF